MAYQDPLELLPVELSLELLSYVHPEDLPSCMLVSKAWYKLVSDDTLWRSVYKARGWPEPQILTEKGWFGAAQTMLTLDWRWHFGSFKSRSLWGHTDSVYCVNLVHRGDDVYLFSGGRDRVINAWNLQSYSRVGSTAAHNGSVLCLRHQGDCLVSGSSDARVKVWRIDTDLQLTEIMCLVGHRKGVVDIRLTDSRIVSAGKDGIRCWDRESGNCIYTLADNDKVTAIDIAGDTLAAVVELSPEVEDGGQSVIRLYSLSGGELIREFRPDAADSDPGGVSCVALNGPVIIAGCHDASIKFFDLDKGKLILNHQGHSNLVRCLKHFPPRLITGAYDGCVRAWDLTPNSISILFSAKPHRSFVFDVDADISHFVTSSHDEHIYVADLGYDLDLRGFRRDLPSLQHTP